MNVRRGGKRLKSHVTTVLAAALLAAAHGDGAAQAPPPVQQNQVLEVLERTKLTRTSYSLFVWIRTTPLHGAPDGWAAEFHSGDLHRVETPTTRVVADCRANTGIAVALDTGETVEGPSVASVACGINTNRIFSAAEYRGTVQTRFGPADRVRLVDDEMIREYDVSADGVLLATRFFANRGGEPEILNAETVALLREPPEPGMFDRESLARSYVPEEYRQPPRRP
ncbi:MAG: hypothetical protein M3177_02320 [Pseudomonadota bacterium]|nr:hypothetical protein [Pseudomonadota bacterium]